MDTPVQSQPREKEVLLVTLLPDSVNKKLNSTQEMNAKYLINKVSSERIYYINKIKIPLVTLH